MANPNPVNPSPESEETIFAAAVLLTSPAARAAYLDQACAGRPELRREVEELLRASDAAGTVLDHSPVASVPAAFLRTPAGAPAIPPLSLPADEGPGTQIGRYKLLEKIGEGGFGEVYVAEQREPVKRKVALKIIKLGMDTRQVIARFEAERQALAMMDHPNIAKVLDAGATDTGRPYFVMELVRGHAITRYCDENHLTAEERLKLFVLVCHAIQHAHQKGIIHRDIKPSNILVTLHDGVPVPKVIDFGIAKATQGELTDKTIHTQFQSFIGTPAYVSPEQVEMSGLDIDTRSDIYALGVLLYELLVGRTPFDGRELLQAGLDSMRRTIRETEPVRPSTRLVTLEGAERTSVSQRRGGTDVAKLAGALRGDVDWIVMKCLEKDRRRRYETANGLAADITRHLTNEPVTARPPSSAYKLHKAWRRNKALVSAGAIVALALIVGVIGITAGLVRAERQRRAAQAAQQEESRQREIAVRALDGERQQASRADAARANLESAAYASAINLAQKAVADQNFGMAWDLLNGQRPGPGRPDRRGWEWRYLWQQCQSDALASPLVLSNRYSDLKVSPDGTLLVANGGQALLDISDPRRARLIGALVFTNSSVEPQVSSFSPDGGLIAIHILIRVPGPANDRNRLQLLDARSRKLVAETEFDSSVSVLEFSPDGKALLAILPDTHSGSQIVGLRVPSLERITNSNWVLPREPFLISLGIREAAVTRDLSTLAAASRDLNGSGDSLHLRVRVFDLGTRNERWSVDAVAVLGMKFSPDGRLLLVSEGMAVQPRVRVFDAHSGQELGPGLTEHHEWISSLVFWPDGKTLATASADQTIRLWDLTEPSRPTPIGRPLQGHRAEVWGLALLPDLRTLVSVDKNGTFLSWDTQQARTDRTRLALASTNGWDTYRFSPDGKTIFAVDNQGNVVRLSGRDFEVRDELVILGEQRYNPVFSPDCHFLACGSTNGLIQIWDLRRRLRLKEFPVGTGRVWPFQFRGGGRSLIVWSDDHRPVREWDLTNFKELVSWQDLPGQSCLSPDDHWYMTLGEVDGRNQFLSRDMVTGVRTVQTNTPFEVEHVAHFTSSPDGSLLVASSEKGYALILDRATLRPLGTLNGFLVQAVFSSCFSPDGKRLATSSGGREALRVWDVDRRQMLVGLQASQRSLFLNSQFSADGNILGAMSAGDRAIHLWRAPSWEEIAAAEAKEPPASDFPGRSTLEVNPP